MDWFHVVKDRNIWRAVIYTVMNIVSVFFPVVVQPHSVSWPPFTVLRDHTQTHHTR
jgi:hypothetical protein